MQFKHYLQTYAANFRRFGDIIRNKALFPIKGEDGSISLRIRADLIKETDMDTVFKVSKQGLAGLLEMYMLGSVYSQGPCIFRPTYEELVALSEMRLNIAIEDYAQPFDFVILELPEQFYKNHIRSEDGNYPSIVILHFNKALDVMISYVLMSGKVEEYSYKNAIEFEQGKLLEDLLGQFTYDFQFPDSMPMDEKEWALSRELMILAINYCLLVEEAGMASLPGNEGYKRRLDHFIKNAEKKGDKEKAAFNKDLLRSEPVYYELNQKVRLYSSVTSDVELDPEATGRSVGPHRRRGHYRMQSYGQGHSLRKRIRIPPVFVNAHKFFGDMSDVTTTYSR